MLAKPWRCMARIRKSPEPSPVNSRPVRLAPCAAGASPTTRSRAAASPKPGTGLPQYLVVAMCGLSVAGDAGAVLPQTRAPCAADDVPAGGGERLRTERPGFTAHGTASACPRAWYELRTSGPDSTCEKPMSSASALSSRNSSVW